MRTSWTKESIQPLFATPLMDLLFQAQTIHRQHFNHHDIELCTLLSIKTGRCPEDCAYCPQSAHYDTEIEPEKLFNLDEVKEKAQEAKRNGAVRFCMGAAWRNPPKRDFPKVLAMIKAVKEIGLETCVTLGMLDDEQTQQLRDAGLDYYNHNLDTSPEHYQKIISTRTYEDRIQTLKRVGNAGIHICCGGIIGMGESEQDRIELLFQLSQLPHPLKSIPINQLIPIPGTPLSDQSQIDSFDFIRMIACTRIVMPTSMIRLSAGRENMSDEMQTLCFLAGANSIFYGEKLLTAKNPSADHDKQLIQKLGMQPKQMAQQVC
jgi:biotin synthase